MACKAKQKGYRTVASGRKIFLSKGYIGSNLEKGGKFTKEKDLFNLWDYIFIKGKTHVFVQFKTNMVFGKNRLRKWCLKYFVFGVKHNSRCVKYEIWNKRDNKGFEVLECNKSKKRYIIR